MTEFRKGTLVLGAAACVAWLAVETPALAKGDKNRAGDRECRYNIRRHDAEFDDQ